MRYLRKFNENSHDFESNAMHGSTHPVWAAEEEARKALLAQIQEHPGYPDVAHLNLSDEEKAKRLGIMPGQPEYKPEEPEVECETCDDEDNTTHEEPEAEDKEERTTFGSRIKSFLGFGK